MYWRPHNGFFTHYVGSDPAYENAEGVYKRVKKSGEIIYELRANQLTGIIQSVAVYDKNVKDNSWKELHLHLMEDGESLVLTLLFDSKLCRMLLYRLPNINPHKLIEINIAKGEKPFLWVRQDGETIKPRFTKQSPGDLPPWEIIKRSDGTPIFKDGQKQYDKTRQDAYLLEKLIPDYQKVIEGQIIDYMAF